MIATDLSVNDLYHQTLNLEEEASISMYPLHGLRGHMNRTYLVLQSTNLSHQIWCFIGLYDLQQLASVHVKTCRPPSEDMSNGTCTLNTKATLTGSIVMCLRAETKVAQRTSLTVMLALMTALETPQARPRAILLGTYTYGTFLSSHSSGKCRMIAKGAVSAARITISLVPRFSVLVALHDMF